MSAVQIDAGELATLQATDTALDNVYTGGAEQPPGNNVMPILPGYDLSKNHNTQDISPQVRNPFTALIVATMTATPPWVAPTLLNSWADFGAPYNSTGYYKDILGIVHIRGLIKSGHITDPIFTLPVGFRPANRYAFCAFGSQSSTAAAYFLIVDTNGDVVVTTGSASVFDYITLDMISFKAA